MPQRTEWSSLYCQGKDPNFGQRVEDSRFYLFPDERHHVQSHTLLLWLYQELKWLPSRQTWVERRLVLLWMQVELNCVRVKSA